MVDRAQVFIPERIAEWAYWIKQRELMRCRKEKFEAGGGKGKHVFSTDPVMAHTRWCNVRRMDDKVSKWLLDYWYPDAETAESWRRVTPWTLVAGALAARMINRPDTLTHITGGNRFRQFNYETFRKRMYEVKATGVPVFTNAYIINGASGGPKIEQVLNAIRKCVEARPFLYLHTESLEHTARELCRLPGVGLFIAGQVVADLRWVLNSNDCWLDRMTWAPPGPGSSKGMKYLLGLASATEMTGRGKDLSESQFLKYLPALVDLAQRHPVVGPIFKERGLEAHDIQNTLCELSKFVRVKNGGRAKNQYPPK